MVTSWLWFIFHVWCFLFPPASKILCQWLAWCLSPEGAQWNSSQSSCTSTPDGQSPTLGRPEPLWLARPSLLASLNVTLCEPSPLMPCLAKGAAPCFYWYGCLFQRARGCQGNGQSAKSLSSENKFKKAGNLPLWCPICASLICSRCGAIAFESILRSQHNNGEPIKTITVVPFDKALGSQLSKDVSWLIHTRRACIPGSEGRKAMMNLPLCALSSLHWACMD